MTSVEIMREKALNLARLNDFLVQVQPPERRKRAILALWECDVISSRAAALLFEHHVV